MSFIFHAFFTQTEFFKFLENYFSSVRFFLSSSFRNNLFRMGVNNVSVSTVFGNQVRHFRQNMGMSQAELAEKAGISQTFLSALERGMKFPGAETIESIARVLNLSYYRLFLNDFSENQASMASQEIFLLEIKTKVINSVSSCFQDLLENN